MITFTRVIGPVDFRRLLAQLGPLVRSAFAPLSGVQRTYRPTGTLWMEHVTQLITLRSGLLLPENTMKFMIKGVVHRQSSESGTTTDILLCDTLGVGAGGEEPLRLG
jgi:hypothetical protein